MQNLGPRKVRDSHKIVHFLRTDLQNLTPTNPSLHKPKDLRVSIESPQLVNISINNSSHFTDYYLKSKDGAYERSLLDVEDLDKVYNVVRENLQVPRPEISIEKDTMTIEFEERVKSDAAYREKMLKEQRQARVVSEKRRVKNDFSNQSSRRNSVMNASFTNQTQKNQDVQGRTLREINKQNIEDLEIKNGRKKVGQYSIEVDRYVGGKISYKVYATLEKPLKPKKKEIKEVDGKDSMLKKLLEDESQAEGIRVRRPEDDNPFLKVLVKEQNPWKRESHYVPLKNEDIDIEARMKKKWNAPDMTSLSGHKVRHSFNKPSIALNDIIEDCETKLKTTKANNSMRTTRERGFLENFNNLSVTSEYRNSVLDREYGISLKDSSLITPTLRLPTLEEKVEERNRLFGKTNEESGKGKPKNIKVELEKYFADYQKMSSRAFRGHRNSQRASIVPRNFHRLSQSRSIREDFVETNDKARYQEQKSIDPNSTWGTFATHSEIGNSRRKGSMIDNAPALNVFLTQSNIEEKENDEQKNVKQEQSEVHPTQRTQSSNAKDIVINEDQNGRIEITTSYDLSDPSPIQGRLWSSKGARTLRMSNILVEGIMERNEDLALDNMQTTSKSSSRYRQYHRSISRQSDLVPTEVKKASCGTPCDQIEDRLNKSFNDFMSVKAKADNKFKAAVDMLVKDRPLINKIRHSKYDVNKIMFNNINKMRGEAESCRQGRFKESEEQRKLYLGILDYIVNQEYNPDKLKACYYFMNVFKELLERGDKLTAENFNQLLNKMDDENSITQLFVGVVGKVFDTLKMKAEDIENVIIRKGVIKHVQESNKKKMALRRESILQVGPGVAGKNLHLQI